ncbi:MAG TPA: hypothetical protein VM097_08100 [Mycobacteriales bacterium]|nr:hypothetical protein [Mycobacteriales bacterium]
MQAPHTLHLDALHLDQTHPLDAVAAVLTAVLGAVALVAVAAGGHRLGMAIGAVGVITGGIGQMISRTRSERFLDVVGLGACAVALGVGAALGGLSFNG